MSVAAVLTAAGSGSRLGHTLPKALVPLGGEPLLRHAARRLLEARTSDGERVTTLVVTAPPDDVDTVRTLLGHLGGDVVVVPGGATRQASVAAALDALGARGPDVDVVLVHDAARPLVPPALVARVVEAVRAGHGAVVPGVPVTDTVKQVGDPTRPAQSSVGSTDAGPRVWPVVRTVPRGDLRAVQTPQGFRLDVLLRAHAHGAHVAHDEALAASDDAGLVELLGEPVWVVEGHEDAAKITTARDLAVAELLLRAAPAAATGPVATTGPAPTAPTTGGHDDPARRRGGAVTTAEEAL